MAEEKSNSHDTPFSVPGLEIVEEDGGNKILNLSGESMTLSVFDLTNPDGIRIVLPDGREKVFEGVHQYSNKVHRLKVDTWIGDLEIE